MIDSLEDDLFPDIGRLPIKDVTEALLLAALRKVEARGAIETAHRIRQRASYIFAYAAAAGLRTGDPAAVIKPLMKPKPKQGSQPALIKLEQVRQLIADVEAERASPILQAGKPTRRPDLGAIRRAAALQMD